MITQVRISGKLGLFFVTLLDFISRFSHASLLINTISTKVIFLEMDYTLISSFFQHPLYSLPNFPHHLHSHLYCFQLQRLFFNMTFFAPKCAQVIGWQYLCAVLFSGNLVVCHSFYCVSWFTVHMPTNNAGVTSML